MRKAARAGRVVYPPYAVHAMLDDDFSREDVVNAILTGEIVEDQFDLKYNEPKFVIYGDALDGRDMGVVAKLDRYGNVGIITVYWLKVTDYD
jgi:hypothetical protein